MAIDWDRVVVEADDNGVVVSAGQVALLIGADADSVTWGNITGDITQQPDLMIELDSKIDVDSPTFTGIPRTPTPPAGNSSTRVASTAFVQGEIATPSDDKTYGRKNSEWSELGTMATVNDVNSNGVYYARRNKSWQQLGSMATKSDVSTNGRLYGRQDGEWSELGKLAKADEPPWNTSANVTEKWVRVNDTFDGEPHPYWEELDEPPWNGSSNPKLYARTSYMQGTPPNQKYKYGWTTFDPPVNTAGNVVKKYYRTNEEGTGEWVEVDEPPLHFSEEPDLYFRTSYMEGTPPNHVFKYGWKKLDPRDLDEPPYTVHGETKKIWGRTNVFPEGASWVELDQPPDNPLATPRFYVRTSYTSAGEVKHGWRQVNSFAFESAGLENVYVAPTGNDNNDGTTRNDAVKTIQRAVELARPMGHAYIWCAEGSYTTSDEIAITNKDITFECLTDGGLVEIASSSSRTDDAVLRLYFAHVRFDCRLKLVINKGIGVAVEHSSSFDIGGLTVSTKGTCIRASNCSTVYASAIYALNTSSLVAGALYGSTMNIGTVNGDYGSSVTKVFNANGSTIMYGSITSGTGEHGINYTTLSTRSNGGRVLTGS